jgi:hypothetical protein
MFQNTQAELDVAPSFFLRSDFADELGFAEHFYSPTPDAPLDAWMTENRKKYFLSDYMPAYLAYFAKGATGYVTTDGKNGFSIPIAGLLGEMLVRMNRAIEKKHGRMATPAEFFPQNDPANVVLHDIRERRAYFVRVTGPAYHELLIGQYGNRSHKA